MCLWTMCHNSIPLTEYATLKKWECLDSATGEALAAAVRKHHLPDFTGWQSGPRPIAAGNDRNPRQAGRAAADIFRDRVKLAVNLLHQAGAAQHDHLLGGGVRAAPDEPRQFDGHARLAFGQFFENNPATFDVTSLFRAT